MRRYILIAPMLAAMLALSGCSVVRDIQTGMLPKIREFQLNATMPSEKQETEKMAQQIVAALDARDKEALRSLFSKKVLSEADDMDEGLAYIMETYQGMSKTYESPGNVIDDHYGPPGRTKLVFGYYNIETDKANYILYFEYQMIDQANPEAVGLVYIKLFDSDLKERSKENRYSSIYGKVGIYTPDWEEEVKKGDK